MRPTESDTRKAVATQADGLVRLMDVGATVVRLAQVSAAVHAAERARAAQGVRDQASRLREMMLGGAA